MPSKEREVLDDEGRPREKRHRSKSERSKSERDGSKTHRSKRSSRSKAADSDVQSTSTTHRRRRRSREGGSVRERRASLTDSQLEEGRSAFSVADRISMPYPSFSKAHSKESVMSRESLTIPTKQASPLTPEPTDIGSNLKRSKSVNDQPSEVHSSGSKKGSRPPTPPDTELTAEEKPRTKTPESVTRSTVERRPSSRVSSASGDTSRIGSKSRITNKSSCLSSQATYVKAPRATTSGEHLRPHDSVKRSASRGSGSDPGSSKQREQGDADSSPPSNSDSSPKTPTQNQAFPMPPPPPPIFPPKLANTYGYEPPVVIPSATPGCVVMTAATPGIDFGAAPPPPPPPPLDFTDAPRVDYLLQNGGLPARVSKNFLSVLPRSNGTRPTNPPLTGAETLFAPFFNLLDQYSTVINKHGSIAVATGHRSVARRLLDRLEHVFSRDLPAHGCSCIICERNDGENRGLNWGEVLEWVSGRIDLPQWPPFDLGELSAKAAESKMDLPRRPNSPIKLDPDIAEEWRDHYLRQSKKVRQAVDKWLHNCAEAPAPPPQEVDDETLTFAVLTNLDAEDRPYFNALFSGARELQPAVRAPTPVRKPRTDFVVKTGLSLQRLYRLAQAPRDAETVVYLIKNRGTHDLLHTISDINNSEWEILTSGRFDGFLWSGADGDDVATPTATESRGPTPANGYFPSSRMNFGGRATPAGLASRMATPHRPYSRTDTATPASFVSMASSSHPSRQAVSNDEEAEIAALAELEREIFAGMEALEDAFEVLHRRAEEVQTALRQRNAGLMQSLRSRRQINVYGGPTSGNSLGSLEHGWYAPTPSDDGGVPMSDDDWGADDFELKPEDSASNISSSRHRRPKRRQERRTPAPIEEDEEEGY
ncbi:hypothetical protein jhhlp_003970 [Lomentospora prolificans]|uniref:5-Methylcytosine G/T mismatch-specific DNA glycosylase n=1 Tax=Lomentospora prolificans TaxID=41688 RepID=A0A2N3NA85_9PEZI|nr:hypothetical protein jhhlp_003970 [Lomentospora prolificans]